MAAFKGGGHDILKQMIKVLQNLEKETKEGRQHVQDGFKMGLRKFDTLIGISRIGTQAFAEVAKLQELALTRGTTAGSLLEKSADNIANLEQGFTGYAMAVGVAADAFDAGLNTNNQEIGRLILSNKLTEKGGKQLAKSLRTNTIGLGYTDEQMSTLSNTTLKLQQTYGVTSQELMSALQALGERLADFGALGIADEASEAAMQMGAMIGKGGEKMGAQILAAATAADKLGQMSALGVAKSREKFLSGQGDTMMNAIDLMLDVGEQSTKVVDRWTKNSKVPMKMLDSANKTYGGIITKAAKFNKAFLEKYAGMTRSEIKEKIKLQLAEVEVNKKFTETWDNVKAKIVGPLKKLLTGWMLKLIKWAENPEFVTLVKYLGVIAGGLGIIKIFGPWLTPLISIGKGLWSVSAKIVLWIAAMIKGMLKTTAARGRLAALKKRGSPGFMTGVKKSKRHTFRGAGGRFAKIPKKGVPKVKAGGGILKGIMRFMGKIGSVLMGVMKWAGRFILTGLMNIPVFGWILAAIVGLVALIIYFKDDIMAFLKPMIDGLQPVFDFFKHQWLKIKAAFSKGMWEGILQLALSFRKAGDRMGLYVKKGFFILMAKLSYYQKTIDKWNNKALVVQKEIAAAVKKDTEERKAMEKAKRLKELAAIQLKNALAEAKKRAIEEKRLLAQGTANELLERINASMNLAAIRRDYAQDLREQQTKSAAELARNMAKKAAGSTMSNE